LGTPNILKITHFIAIEIKYLPLAVLTDLISMKQPYEANIKKKKKIEIFVHFSLGIFKPFLGKYFFSPDIALTFQM